MTKPIVIAVMLAIAFCVKGYPPAYGQQIATLGEAINVAGRQRMLTQRMIKAYSEVGMDEVYSFHDAHAHLSEAVSLFDRQLRQLDDFAYDGVTRQRLRDVRSLWVQFAPVVGAPPTKARAIPLNTLGERLLASAHSVVLSLQDISDAEIAEIVNISGRQRMLSQRLAKFYAIEAWGLERTEISEERQRAFSEFESAMSRLQSTSLNTQETLELLKKADVQWRFFRDRLEKSREESTTMLVAITSEKLLDLFNQLTGAYAVIEQ
ncbi:MAG: type IV pili methyl-accepting chemotaxis transducer N-terminal domain-containing protein [Pseudomonadota bacterium]